jgi:hypothetical protein
MAVDYTVILSTRQRFGDNTKEDGLNLIETEAPFVGRAKDFPFACPSVNRSQSAVLQFESMGVSFRGILQINGVAIFGGLTAGAGLLDSPVGGGGLTPVWKAHNLVVHENVLRDQNVLHVEAAATPGGNVDDFIIDNVVLFFKTRTIGPVGPVSPIDGIVTK